MSEGEGPETKQAHYTHIRISLLMGGLYTYIPINGGFISICTIKLRISASTYAMYNCTNLQFEHQTSLLLWHQFHQ